VKRAKKNWCAFGNDELAKMPPLKKGDTVTCRRCGKRHRVYGGKLADGTESNILMFVRCGRKSYLAGVSGKRVYGEARR